MAENADLKAMEMWELASRGTRFGSTESKVSGARSDVANGLELSESSAVTVFCVLPFA